jgi:hypothetical protein
MPISPIAARTRAPDETRCQRHQRQDAALALVVRVHHQQHVFDRHDQQQRPEDQRQDAEHLRRAHRAVAEIGQARLEGIERAGADIAVDHAQHAKHHRRTRSGTAGRHREGDVTHRPPPPRYSPSALASSRRIMRSHRRRHPRLLQRHINGYLDARAGSDKRTRGVASRHRWRAGGAAARNSNWPAIALDE